MNIKFRQSRDEASQLHLWHQCWRSRWFTENTHT